MKRSVGIALAGAAGLLLTFASGNVFGAVLNYSVLLTPQGNGQGGGTLNVHLGFGQSCASNPHDGCMNFQTDAVGAITFRLPGPSDRMTCTNPAQPQKVAAKVITGIQVTETPYKQNPQKGNFSGRVTGTELKKYAFPQADANGFIYKVNNKNEGLARVTVINMNSHPAAQGTKSFWYRIKVEDCSNNGYWQTDPRGDNEGLW